MNADGKDEALTDWHKLMKNPGPRMDAEELYDELLKMADRFKFIGLITDAEWKGLVEEGGFLRAIEGGAERGDVETKKPAGVSGLAFHRSAGPSAVASVDGSRKASMRTGPRSMPHVAHSESLGHYRPLP